MNPDTQKPSLKKDTSTIDSYIAAFPPEKQQLLQKVRKTIGEAAPEATEKISWQMPTFFYCENVIHFAMFQKHIGLYPSPQAIEHFAKQLAPYKTSKGAIQFPLDKPMPYSLIAEITRYRINLLKEKHQPL